MAGYDSENVFTLSNTVSLSKGDVSFCKDYTASITPVTGSWPFNDVATARRDMQLILAMNTNNDPNVRVLTLFTNDPQDQVTLHGDLSSPTEFEVIFTAALERYPAITASFNFKIRIVCQKDTLSFV